MAKKTAKQNIATLRLISARRKKSRKMAIPRNLLKQTRARVKMKFGDSYQLTQLTSGIAAKYIFRWTSINDPDFSSGSIADHQPWGHDTYANFFKHYTVIGCTAKVTVTHVNPTDNPSTIFLTNSAVSAPANLVTYSQHLENPASSGGIIRGATNGIRTFTKSYSKSKVFGKTQNSKLTQLMNGNTDEEYYLIVSLLNTDPGGTAGPVVWQIELNYDVELTENKTLAQS